MQNKKNVDIIRSSAAEYLTFITATGDGDVNAVYADENVWLTQKMMGVLYDVGTNTINYHIKKLFRDGEIDEDSVIRKFRITAADGKVYETSHYNLSANIAVGNKVDSQRAVQFRKWKMREPYPQRSPMTTLSLSSRSPASSRIALSKATSTSSF